MTWALDLARHRVTAEGSSPLFGIVLYTDAHANTKKMLQDRDYWDALDEISGPQWTIFSTRAHRGTYETPQMPPGTIGMMCLVWKEPSSNRELLQAFDIDSTETLPVLVVFVLEGSDLLSKTAIKLDDSSIEAAFTSIRTAVHSVSQALLKIPNDQLQDPKEVSQTIEKALQTKERMKRLRNAYSILKEIRDWLPI